MLKNSYHLTKTINQTPKIHPNHLMLIQIFMNQQLKYKNNRPFIGDPVDYDNKCVDNSLMYSAVGVLGSKFN